MIEWLKRMLYWSYIPEPKDDYIKLGIVFDKDRDSGFDVVDVVSGRRLSGIYKCKYNADFNTAASAEIGLYLCNENGSRYAGNGVRLDFEVGKINRFKRRGDPYNFMRLHCD